MKGMFWLAAALALAWTLGGHGYGGSGSGSKGTPQPQLLAGRAYRALLAPADYDLGLIQTRAQALGWWVRLQEGLTVRYWQGPRLCGACDPALEAEFLTLPQLLIDGEDFMVRSDEPAFRLNLRPAAGEGGYELTLIMTADLGADVAWQRLNARLADLGIPPQKTLDMDIEPLPEGGGRKIRVPEGVRLDETLYRLVGAPDWPDFAAAHDLSMSGLRVRAVVELTDPAQLPRSDDLVIEAQAGSLLRAQVLVHRLIALAQDPAVQRVRPPLKPQPGGGR